MPQGLIYEWAIDGRVTSASLEPTFTTHFAPAATLDERRKDYKVSVRVGAYIAETIVRVAQNVNIGTINVAQSNEGMDILNWTDNIEAKLDENKYQTGIEVTDEEFEKINIEKSTFHGEWNYIIKPKT